MNRRNRQFVKYVKNHLAQYDMKVIIGRGKLVNVGGYRCEGFFDENKKIIKIASQCNNFLETLVHEYCHFLQFISKSKIYQKSNYAGYIIDTWFNGENYSPEKLKRAFFLVRAMELDCEKRAVKIIKKFNLKIDQILYTKRAHCYIYSHFMMEKTRKFYAFKKSPYRSSVVLKIMPSKINVSSHKTIPPKIYSVLESFII
jgi:hypothetical protein